MKLYYAPGACSLAVHIVLREAERRFDLERVDLRTLRTSRGVELLHVNPKGDVPVLELDDAGHEKLTETQVILQYVADLVPEKRLAPPYGTFARYHLQEWLSFIASELHAQLSPLWHATTPEAYAARVRGHVAERFNYVQDVLVDRGHLMGETFTIADAYLYVLLTWCEKLGIDLHLFPNLDDYEYRITQRPSVLAALAAEGLGPRHHLRRTA